MIHILFRILSILLLYLISFATFSEESVEIDIPGPNIDFLKFEVDKAMKNGDEKRFFKYLTEVGLHCGALYSSETQIQGFCQKDKDCTDKLNEFLMYSLDISMLTLNQTQAIEEISSRGFKIIQWVEDHIAAGSISEAGPLLSEELKTCTTMVLGLKENIEEMLK